jgi:hypothetical protein
LPCWFLPPAFPSPRSWSNNIQKNSYKKKQWRPPSKKKKRGESLNPRNKKACHNVSIALLQRVAEIGTQSTMKSSKKTLHEFTPHIAPKTPKRNNSSANSKMLQTDITVRAQGARVSDSHARESDELPPK